MPLQQMNVIDLIALDPATDEVVLGMTETRPWETSERRLFELQEKLNTYLSFALDGEMAEHYPDFAPKRLRIQLSCIEEPSPVVGQFINMVAEQIGFQGIKFETKVLPELATVNQGECGSTGEGGCGCAHEIPEHESATTGCCGGGGSNSGQGCGCH